MAKRSNGIAAEFAGTEAPSGNADAIPGTSEPIDPGTIPGSGGSDIGGTGEFDPRIHAGIDKRNADGTFTRKRGRKAGGGNSGSRKAGSSADLKTSIDALSKTLVIVHVGIAGITNAPEFAIDKDEADLLANATANVLEQFDLKPDPRTQAIVGLVMACGTVYGPRAYMISARRSQEKKERAAKNGAGVAGIYAANGEAVGTAEFTTEFHTVSVDAPMRPNTPQQPGPIN